MPDQLAKDLQVMLAAAKKQRREKDDIWKENLDWLLGKQQLNKPQWKSNTVTNFLFSQIMTIVPKLAGGIPEFDIRPEVPDMQGQADEISRLIRRTMIRNDFDRRQVENMTNLLIYGISFYKMTFDEGPGAARATSGSKPWTPETSSWNPARCRCAIRTTSSRPATSTR